MVEIKSTGVVLFVSPILGKEAFGLFGTQNAPPRSQKELRRKIKINLFFLTCDFSRTALFKERDTRTKLQEELQKATLEKLGPVTLACPIYPTIALSLLFGDFPMFIKEARWEFAAHCRTSPCCVLQSPPPSHLIMRAHTHTNLPWHFPSPSWSPPSALPAFI